MKTIKNFEHINARTIEEAAAALGQYGDKACVVAGGTDLIGTMRFEILREYPKAVINLKTIPGLDYIREENGVLKIGALTRLEEISLNPAVRSKYKALAEAAHQTASPHIRAMGTIGGNICQLNRCWYFRKENNRFNCTRKGGGMCNAMIGDNRYHSIFGIARIDSTPCTSECPVNTDIPTYLSLIREGKLNEAAQIILEVNPVPAITGRVCPHYCENKCNRNDFDESVSIRNIERFMGDYILEHPEVIGKLESRGIKKKIAVVGSGPAGLSAAFYLKRRGHEVTIYENMPEAGGLLTYGIPPYRLPKDVVRSQIKTLQMTGIQIKLNAGVSKNVEINELARTYDAVFLACGACKERNSEIKGERLLLSGAEFLRKFNSWEMQKLGKKVAVIGAGNTAIDVARTLVRMGADPTIIYRRTRAEMPALKEEVEKAEQEGIEFRFLALPLEASRKDNQIVLKCTKMELGPIDESGRPRPIPVKGSEFTLEFDAVIGAMGEGPDYSMVPVEYLNENGKLTTDSSFCHLGSNIFAGGDFVSGPSTVVQALMAGRKAASLIDESLGGKKEPGPKMQDQGSKYPEKFNRYCLERTNRASASELPVSERIKSLEVEDVGSLELSSVGIEANRCFNCGCMAVNPSDLAPALIALDAKIITSRRAINADQFWAANETIKSTVLDSDEIVTEIQIPEPSNKVKSAFIKFALRKSIDFPIVNCAAAIESNGQVVKSARICLNSVYLQPYRVTKAEDFIKDKPLDEANAEASSEAAISDSIALPYNRYKIQIAKAMVKRAILACK
jgi:NADPH-dependent glutamate synthase beta subunit-like oxidoreductase/CO/xanthine dehydrogenase FAD-binding subunit